MPQGAGQKSFAQMVADGPQPLLRSASQKSVSTDEGSTCSSSLGSSEGAKPKSSQASTSPAAKEVDHNKTVPDLPRYVSTQHEPLWVDNGLKGDRAAWLWVLPKFPERNGDIPANGVIHMLKSPKDAVLMGPYICTKNTFLDEALVGGPFSLKQKPRARSWDGSRSCERQQ